MFGLGTTELVIILVIVMVVFGASRLPGLGKGLGEGIRSFRNGLKGNPALLVLVGAHHARVCSVELVNQLNRIPSGYVRFLDDLLLVRIESR